MAEFMGDDLRGSRFARVDLSGAEFWASRLTGARFRGVELDHVRMTGAELADVDISGVIRNLTINGVDVGPLVEAELNRRHPDRAKLRPADPAGFREAWQMLVAGWEPTVARARKLDPELLHQSVDGEWSFIETLRHLLFATDTWIRRVMLGEPAPWHPLDLPWEESPEDLPGIPRDRTARPSLETVLELRRDRQATVGRVIDGLTQVLLDSDTEPVEAPGWPPSRRYPVRRCLEIILTEEWEHRRYAERDLAVLEQRA